MDGLSASDAAAIRGEGLGADGGFMWIFALLILMFGMGNGGFWGGNRGPDLATADQVAQGFNNQNMQQILLSSANNNYETAQLINGQTNMLMQQNNTNLINAIQGFNTVNQNMSAGFAAIANQLSQLGYHMDQCCCEIKTQMLQDRLQDTQFALQNANDIANNASQSMYLISQLKTATA
jgi:hypothetical protein